MSQTYQLKTKLAGAIKEAWKL